MPDDSGHASVDATNQDRQPDQSNRWAAWQREVYGLGKPTTFPTNMTELEPLVHAKVGRNEFWYAAGSAGLQRTASANVAAFTKLGIAPRMLVDSNKQSLKTTVFGREFSAPLAFAPVGVLGLYHEEGELAVARAAERVGIPMIMSTAATRSIEAVGTANGNGERWFQLYWPRTEEISLSLLQRAKQSGFTALFVTLDTIVLGHRPHDLDAAYLPFLHGDGCQVGFSDPAFAKRHGFEANEKFADSALGEAKVREISMQWLGEVNSGFYRTWEDVATLRKMWDGPLVLKGIMRSEDAIAAIEAGCDGIVVSNHGGRQIDGSISSLQALRNIMSHKAFLDARRARAADGTGRSFDVFFDSGVRSGSDVIKAIAIGADMVLIGRPYVYGLALDGEEGVRQVARSLLSEVQVNMGLMGCPTLAGLRGKADEWLEQIV